MFAERMHNFKTVPTPILPTELNEHPSLVVCELALKKYVCLPGAPLELIIIHL